MVRIKYKNNLTQKPNSIVLYLFVQNPNLQPLFYSISSYNPKSPNLSTWKTPVKKFPISSVPIHYAIKQHFPETKKIQEKNNKNYWPSDIQPPKTQAKKSQNSWGRHYKSRIQQTLIHHPALQPPSNLGLWTSMASTWKQPGLWSSFYLSVGLT